MKIKLLCVLCATLLSEDKQTQIQSVSFEPMYPEKLPEGFTKANDMLLKDKIEFTIKNKELFDKFKTGESYELELVESLLTKEISGNVQVRTDALKLINELPDAIIDLRAYVNGNKKMNKQQVLDMLTATFFEVQTFLEKHDPDGEVINRIHATT